MNGLTDNGNSLELDGVDDTPLAGRMEFDQLVYRWTSSIRSNEEPNVCVSLRDGDAAKAMVELWFKEEARALCEVALISINKKYNLKARGKLPQTKGVIIANEKMLGPRAEKKFELPSETIVFLDHNVNGYTKRPISVAISQTEIEIDFGGITEATQEIVGPNIFQYTKNQILVGLRFKDFDVVDIYQSN